MKKYMSNKLAVFLFVTPAVLAFLSFIFVPIVQVFYYSFFQWKGIGAARFLGLDNYTRLFQDKTFLVANRNQLIFSILITIYQIVLATVFSITVSNPKQRARKFFRVAFFIPVVLSVTVVCQLWLSILNADNGLLNQLFIRLGTDYQQNWLGERYHAIYVIAFVNAWQWMGYQFALINAGIKSIPTDYYEAARIDGATNRQAHTKITIPLLKETYKFCLVVSVTGGIKAFTEIFIMTGGGPGKATYTLTMMMYTSAFRSKEYGYGLSAAAIMVMECMLILLVVNFIFRDREEWKEKREAKKALRQQGGDRA